MERISHRADKKWSQPWVWITLVWCAVYGYPFAKALFSHTWVFHDPDTYMRLHRMAELLDGGGWFNPLIRRIASEPEGFVMHWGRPLDAITCAIVHLMGSSVPRTQALIGISSLLNTLWPLGAACLLGTLSRSILSPLGCLIVGLLSLTEGWVMGYSSPSHPDHHSLLGACAVVSLALMAHFHHRPTLKLASAWAVVNALGFWVSFEWTILFSVLWAGWFLYVLLVRPERCVFLVWALEITLLLTSLALLLERGGVWDSFEHDRLSLTHVLYIGVLWVITFLVDLGFRRMAFRGWKARLCLGVFVGLFVTGLVMFFAPSWLGGFGRVIDPRINPIWHDYVSEILPLFQGKDRWAVLFYAMGHPFTAGAFLGGCVLLKKGKLPLALYASATGLCLYIPLAFYQIRHGLFTQIFSVVPLVYGFEVLARHWAWRSWLRTGLMGVLVVTPTLLAMVFSPRYPTSELDHYPAPCRTWDGMITFLQQMEKTSPPQTPETAPVFLTTLGVESTRILFETSFRILGVPYHRNVAGVVASYDIFSAPTLDKGLQALYKHNVGYILVAKDHLKQWMDSTRTAPSAFHHHVLNLRHKTKGLNPIKLPEPLDQRFILLHVDRTSSPLLGSSRTLTP